MILSGQRIVRDLSDLLGSLADSRKARAINAGRFTMMAQRTEPTTRYVSVEGPVTRTLPGSHERSLEMAQRYLPPDEAAEFVEYERTRLGEHVAICMRPEHWLSTDLGPAGLT